jgi:hypothetical protein
MSKKTASTRKRSMTRRRFQILIAAVVLGLFAAWTMLAYSGALDSLLRQKRKKGQDFSAASFNSNSPSKEYIYAGGRLVATEEPTTSSAPSAPTGLDAKAVSSGQIQLTWNAPSSGAVDHYEIYRTNNVDSFGAPLTTWSASPYTDNVSFTSVVTYVYKVRAVGPGGTSPDSILDYATTIIFTNDVGLNPLHGVTIYAQHLVELRQAVVAIRAIKGLGAPSWTDPSLTPGQTPVRGAHIDELRTKLNEALNALSGQVPAAQNWVNQAYTNASPLAQKTIYAVDFQEIRERVK